MIRKGIVFEAKRYIKDLPQLILTALGVVALIAFAFMLSYLSFGWEPGLEPGLEPLEWNDEVYESICRTRDEYYGYYLLDLEQGVDPYRSLRFYRLCLYSLEHQMPTRNVYFMGYGLRGSLIPYQGRFADIPALQAYRLFFYQDIIYFFLPLFLVAPFYSAFASLRSLGYQKNFRLLSLNEKRIRIGQFLFLFLLLFGLILFFALVGFVFFDGGSMLLYTGEAWIERPIMAVYFERWGLVLVAMLAFFAFCAFVSLFPLPRLLHLATTLLGCMTLPILGLDAVRLGTMSREELCDQPFLSLTVSDGFASDRLWFNLLVPLGFVLGFALLGAAYLLLRRLWRKKCR